MDFKFDMPKPHCPVVDVDGIIAKGKQFDLDITLADDNRDVIYGVIRDCYKEPVRDAVVKLIEVDRKDKKEERKPVSHTFTDKNGEFVFGPLCPGKEYAIQIWVDDVKHIKVCAKAFHEGKCLKGVKFDKCDHDLKHYERPNYYEEYKDKDYEKHYDEEYKDKDYEKHYDEEYKDKDYDKHYDEEYKDKEHDKKHHDECKCKDYDKKDYDEYKHEDCDKKDYDEYKHEDCDKKDEKKDDKKDDKKEDKKEECKCNKYYNYR